MNQIPVRSDDIETWMEPQDCRGRASRMRTGRDL
jgi:hypothetical protein